MESTPLDPAELDPGIRNLVMALRAAGYNTTDSGDGVSKPKDWYESGEALPYPHVAIVLADASRLVVEAHRLQAWLDLVWGGGWTVEASFRPSDGVGILMVFNEQPPDLLRNIALGLFADSDADLHGWLVDTTKQTSHVAHRRLEE